MAAPIVLAPATVKALQWGAVAALALYAAHQRGRGPRNSMREAALDDVPEGLTVETARQSGAARADVAARWRRTVRLGRSGPGLEVDLSGVARARIRPVKPSR